MKRVSEQERDTSFSLTKWSSKVYFLKGAISTSGGVLKWRFLFSSFPFLSIPESIGWRKAKNYCSTERDFFKHFSGAFFEGYISYSQKLKERGHGIGAEMS